MKKGFTTNSSIMNFNTSFYKCSIYLLLFTLSVNKSWSKLHNAMCGDSRLIQPKGNISSPYYPVLYPFAIYCTWHILSPPQSTLRINIKDFDIPDDPGCDRPPCCRFNFISLPVNEKVGTYESICGNISNSVISVSQIHTTISFHYSEPSQSRSRGFQLSYSIEKNVCDDDFRCNDGKCLEMSKKCDGIPHCSDGSDEIDCSRSTECAEEEIPCGPSSNHCFKLKDRCDNVFQCPLGEDEIGCSSYCEFGIKCQNIAQCFLPTQRCDGHLDCVDGSDEAVCPDELCPLMPNKRQCHNGHCLEAKLWCDGKDDCGDFSDEEACINNSMITVAMMAALLGGLLLVLAVGCSLRLYSRRCSSSHNCQLRLAPPGAPRLRMPHSLSLPALIDNEFFHREPPPMYSLAVGAAGLPRRTRGNRSRGASRRSNHRHTVNVPVPVPKPPSENTLNASSSPSSEDNLMCASNIQVSNTDDSEQLISA